jgi:proteic killer suppression protein
VLDREHVGRKVIEGIGPYLEPKACDLDLRSPPSNHFEKLRGNMAGKYSIALSKQWRLVFTWSGERGAAQDIYLDNHDYR